MWFSLFCLHCIHVIYVAVCYVCYIYFVSFSYFVALIIIVVIIVVVKVDECLFLHAIVLIASKLFMRRDKVALFETHTSPYLHAGTKAMRV